MKITTFILFVACLQVAARSEGQTVNLSLKNASVRQVFKAIQKQTGLNILVDERFLRKKERITLQGKDMPISEVLKKCFPGEEVNFTIEGGAIIVKEKLPLPPDTPILTKNDPPLEIRGVVTDENGKHLAGASVRVKGTSLGTTSDADGGFVLQVPDESSVLIVSFVGYQAVELSIPKTGMVNAILKLGDGSNDEVIVVGYNNKKRSELTSAVSVVSEQKLKDVTTNDFGAMLQGKVAGLQVVNSSGVPGAASEIRLRGISSVNASQSPLIVVDGIIGGNFDPNDVENITVLKDAGATAMYGSQANAGVIIVSTKKAKSGKARFNVKAVNGFRKPDFGKMEMMNGSQLYDYQKEFYRDYNAAATDNSYKVDLLKFYNERPRPLRDENHNWLTEIFQPAYVQNYFVSFSGKTEKTEYYTGLTYFNEQGTFTNTKYQRVNLRANTQYHFSDRISLTNNINLSASSGKSYDYMDIYYAYLNLPWDNPYDSAGKPLYVDGNSNFKWWSRDKINPVHTINNSNHPYKNFDGNYDFNLNVVITRWLSFTSTNRLSAGYSSSTSYFSPLVAGTYHGLGFLDETRGLYYGGISTDLLKFNFRKGDHTISGLAGVAFEGGRSELLGGSGKGLPLGLSVLNVVSSNILVQGSNDRSSIQSFISQLNYGYKNKYFLTGSYRVDGSSAFPSNNRYASFPSVSAAWIVSNESFFNNKTIIDNLKVRASYGVTGTQDIGASRYLGLYSLSSQYNAQVAATPLQLSSPELTWESKYQLNAGLDISLFKRINLSVDVYNNVTKNLLLEASQPLSVGFEQRWENTGEIVNKGLEISVSSVNIRTHNFEWSTDFNLNFNTNKLQKFPDQIIRTTGAWPISQIYREGGNLYEFYMPKWLGVDPQTGAPLWEKVTKNAQGNVVGTEPTSEYAAATYQEVGSALPKYQGGLSTYFRFKNITVGGSAYFIYGNKVFSNNLRFVMNDGGEPYMNQIVLPAGYSIWTKPGDIATNPSPQNSANSTETSTRYLKDGSYISLRNVSIAYELPEKYALKARMEGVTVSISADNIYTFTRFLGQDPQTTITSGSYVTPGVSDFKYPNNRQILLNLNFRF